MATLVEVPVIGEDDERVAGEIERAGDRTQPRVGLGRRGPPGRAGSAARVMPGVVDLVEVDEQEVDLVALDHPDGRVGARLIGRVGLVMDEEARRQVSLGDERREPVGPGHPGPQPGVMGRVEDAVLDPGGCRRDIRRVHRQATVQLCPGPSHEDGPARH